MESIAITPGERKNLILGMKREIKPSRRLRMHIVLLASEGYSPTEISRTLFCSRTTVYAIGGRFVREGPGAFDDRKRRGPAPLVDVSAQELVEDLAEGVVPTERGWLCVRAGVASSPGARAFQGPSAHREPRDAQACAAPSGVSLEETPPPPASQRSPTEAKKARSDP